MKPEYLLIYLFFLKGPFGHYIRGCYITLKNSSRGLSSEPFFGSGILKFPHFNRQEPSGGDGARFEWRHPTHSTCISRALHLQKPQDFRLQQEQRRGCAEIKRVKICLLQTTLYRFIKSAVVCVVRHGCT